MNKLIKSLMLVALMTFALNTEAQIKLGVKAGLNLNSVAQDYTVSDFEIETKTNLGFHLGLAAELGFSDQLALQTGLIYTKKGISVDLEEGLDSDVYESVDGFKRSSLSYLEIPLNIAYKMDAIQFYAGPYVAIGMGGKHSWDYTYKYKADGVDDVSSKGDSDIKPIFGDVESGDLKDDESSYQGLDFGLNFGAGFAMSDAMLINLGYSLGLSNTTNGYEGFSADDFKTTNRVITLSATYFFGQ